MDRQDELDLLGIPGWHACRKRLASRPGVHAIRAEAWLPRLVVTANGLIDRARPGSILAWFSPVEEDGTILYRIETRGLDATSLEALLGYLRLEPAKLDQA